MYKPEFDIEKFRELMLYIADQSRDDPWFGVGKLNTILYFCDFQYYARFYKSITGATYTKMLGPPVPKQLMHERQALIDEGSATIEINEMFTGHTQQRLKPNRRGLELGIRFTDDEKKVIDRVLSFLKPMTAKEASDKSNEELGWTLARPEETIPYETAWLAPHKPLVNVGADAWSKLLEVGFVERLPRNYRDNVEEYFGWLCARARESADRGETRVVYDRDGNLVFPFNLPEPGTNSMSRWKLTFELLDERASYYSVKHVERMD